MMQSADEYVVILYIFFWVVRIRGCFRRGRQPLLRGPEWFFNVHVRPDFYTGAGKKLLHRYWMRMLMPFALRARPVKLPDFLHESDIARWPVCYQPSAPMLILKGAHGYSLNLANTLAHLGAAYLAGLAVLIVLLRMGH